MDEKIGGLQREFKRLSEQLSAEKRDTQALLCVYRDGLKEVGSALGGLKKDLNEVKASRPTPPQGPNPPELGHLQTEMARVSSFEKELRALGDKVSYLDSTYQNKGLAPPSDGNIERRVGEVEGQIEMHQIMLESLGTRVKGIQGEVAFFWECLDGLRPQSGPVENGLRPRGGPADIPSLPSLPSLPPSLPPLPSFPAPVAMSQNGLNRHQGTSVLGGGMHEWPLLSTWGKEMHMSARAPLHPRGRLPPFLQAGSSGCGVG